MPPQPDPDAFPPDFTWGVATSAYQIEGAWHAAGKGLSVWDTFVRQPGTVAGGDTGDVACDSYHRWEDDLELLDRLGVDSYRFSISWPRVLPDGTTGSLDEPGLDHYDRFVDGLLDRGIEPTVTLHHWDLPQALQDRGGWLERATAHRFAGYAGLVADRLGDRVDRWITLNEPWVVVELGHVTGQHAPGITDAALAARAHHHLLLGHGLAVRALRDAGVAGAVGITNAETYMEPTTPGAEPAAEVLRDRWTRAYTGPVLGRGYPAEVHRRYAEAGGSLPVTGDDHDIIAAPIDLLGVNLYTRLRVGPPGPDDGGDWSLAAPENELTAMGWEIAPSALGDHLRWLDAEYGDDLPPLQITENGMATDQSEGPRSGRSPADDRTAADESPREPDEGEPVVDDPDRVAFLGSYLASLQGAVADGVDVRGYFLWTLLDNFEWDHGYSKRFGLVWVDHDAWGRRVPKTSFHWYRDFIAAAG